jgi:hypothetical protein
MGFSWSDPGDQNDLSFANIPDYEVNVIRGHHVVEHMHERQVQAAVGMLMLEVFHLFRSERLNLIVRGSRAQWKSPATRISFCSIWK